MAIKTFQDDSFRGAARFGIAASALSHLAFFVFFTAALVSVSPSANAQFFPYFHGGAGFGPRMRPMAPFGGTSPFGFARRGMYGGAYNRSPYGPFGAPGAGYGPRPSIYQPGAPFYRPPSIARPEERPQAPLYRPSIVTRPMERRQAPMYQAPSLARPAERPQTPLMARPTQQPNSPLYRALPSAQQTLRALQPAQAEQVFPGVGPCRHRGCANGPAYRNGHGDGSWPSGVASGGGPKPPGPGVGALGGRSPSASDGASTTGWPPPGRGPAGGKGSGEPTLPPPPPQIGLPRPNPVFWPPVVLLIPSHLGNRPATVSPPAAPPKAPAPSKESRANTPPPPPEQPYVFPSHWRIAAPPTQPPSGGAGAPPPTSGRPTSGAPAAEVFAAKEDRFVRDEILVEFRPDVSLQTANDIAKREELRLLASQRLELIDSTINRYQIPQGRSVPEVLAALGKDQRIASMQPNYLYTLQREGEGGRPQEQYARAKMHLDEAHAITNGGKTLVGVIDTTIDADHPEIAGSIANSLDIVAADPKPDVKGTQTYENALVTMSRDSEPEAHGTAIAGVIAAHAELTGVAPKARILAVRAFGPRSDGLGAQGTTHNIMIGIDWAYVQGARVVNLSFGGPQDQLLSDALALGATRGMIFVASVGNQGKTAKPLYPALDKHVIAVTASDKEDGVFKNANRCSLACIAAPGVDVRVAATSGDYQTVSGTSLAAAHVSGVVALVLDKRPDLEQTNVRDALFKATNHPSRVDAAENLVAGVVDAYQTLENLPEPGVHAVVATDETRKGEAVRSSYAPAVFTYMLEFKGGE